MKLSLRHLVCLAPAYALAAWAVNWYAVIPGLETYLRWSSMLLPLVLIIAFGRNHSNRPSTILAIAGLIYFTVVILSSSLGGLSSYEGTNVARLLLSFSFLYYVTRVLGAERNIAISLIQLKYCAFILCGLSLILWLFGEGFSANGRLYGVGSEPNLLGFVCMVLAATCCATWGGKRSRFLNFAMYAVALGTAYLTAGILALATVLALGASVVAFYLARISHVRLPVIIMWRTRAVTMIGCALLFAPLTLFMFGQQTIRDALFGNLSSMERVLAWSTAIDRFFANPWLGAGYSARTELNLTHSLMYAHSAIIDHMGSVGLIGTVLFVAMVFIVCAHAIDAVRSGLAHRHLPTIGSAETCCLILFAILAYSSVEAGLQILPISWVLFWVVAGATLVLLKPAPKEKV